MKEKRIELEDVTLLFTYSENHRELSLAKSQTRVKDAKQLRLFTEISEKNFVPAKVEEKGDAFHFSFSIDKNKKNWDDVKKLRRNDKLRLLCNLLQLKDYLHSRNTLIIHPDNVLFDDNLQPHIIYRGVRQLLPPFEMTAEEFLKQIKCYTIALFSKTYSYEQLYNGELERVKETEFQRKVSESNNIDELYQFLLESYRKEQQQTEKTMKLVPTKKFLLFKRLSIAFMIVTVLLAAPLLYLGFFHLPFQDRLLDAQESYLAGDYNEVISILNKDSVEKLPKTTKYILAYSYLINEPLSDEDRKSIMNNISLQSDSNYLQYWIYNGRGEFEEAMDEAKFLDDPQLILYGLIKQLEQAKNDPELRGEERETRVNDLHEEIRQYREDLNIDESDEGSEEQDVDAEGNEE